MVDMNLVIESGQWFVRELVNNLEGAGIHLGVSPKWNKYGYVEHVPIQEVRILTGRVGEKTYAVPTADLEGASKGYFDSRANLRHIIATVVRDSRPPSRIDQAEVPQACPGRPASSEKLLLGCTHPVCAPARFRR
jgi:hypothetical protein